MNILIVDDSAMMRGVIKQAISNNAENVDVNFVEAEDGQQALDKLKSNEINIVFLDWNMPVLDGLSFTKQVRGDGNDVPIIMVTSVTDQAKIIEAGEAGVNSYLEKPIRGDKLWGNIKEYF